MALTAKQELFCKEYIVDLNATQAAIRAGYSEKTAKQMGCENLAKPDVSDYIQQLMNERSKRTEIKADDVLKELAHIAFSDIKNYLSFRTEKQVVGYSDGQPVYDYQTVVEVKDSDSIDTRNISEVQITKDGFKFKTYCKDHALVNVGKHLGMFVDKVEHSGDVAININIKGSKNGH